MKLEPVVALIVSKNADGETPNASAFERSNFVTKYVPVNMAGKRTCVRIGSVRASAKIALPTLLSVGKPRLLMSWTCIATAPVEPSPGIAGGFAGSAVTPGSFANRVYNAY